MRTETTAEPAGVAAIVHLAGTAAGSGAGSGSGGGVVEDAAKWPVDPAAVGSASGRVGVDPVVDPVARARAFAEPLLDGQPLDTGEDALMHADGVADVLCMIGAAPALCAAAYLVYAGDYLARPEDTVRKAFGESYASLVTLTRKLVQIQRAARAAQIGGAQRGLQNERVRKMLLAFSRDLRVVLLRLASRLQTLRWFAADKRHCPPELAAESMEVFAPLANRLGIWQIKWELEDLSFRYLQPERYAEMARLVDQTRAEREASIAAARGQLAAALRAHGLQADVQGRPKHLYSIWKKMQGKGLGFAGVLDALALRVVVGSSGDCYAVLARVHEIWPMVDGEFDDYIAKPKPNGYQSLHTVVLCDDGRPLEVQIRTLQMHQHAEHGVAAHWMYKESNYGRGAGAPEEAADERIAAARLVVLRELLAWEREHTLLGAAPGSSTFDERIYVFTPQATLIDLPAGGTAVDFAYSLHTDLGHRCRGARVDGAMVPLTTPLQSGQTVEIVAAKEGGPSLDWLNADLGYLASPRARAKVRAWFNSEQQARTIARGRDQVEKLLQREGRTALERDALAEQLGFRNAEALFEVVGKDEFSLRNIANLLHPADLPPQNEIALRPARSEAGGGRGGVLVVGIDSLLTNLARCCRPAPPDAISGFVTRGKGVAVHRRDCSNLTHMAQSAPGRVIEVAWGAPTGNMTTVYPLEVIVEAADRPGLLRDISEVFAKDRINVTGVNTQSAKDRSRAWMTFTVEAADASRLTPVLTQIDRVAGVRHVRRK